MFGMLIRLLECRIEVKMRLRPRKDLRLDLGLRIPELPVVGVDDQPTVNFKN